METLVGSGLDSAGAQEPGLGWRKSDGLARMRKGLIRQ